MLRPKAVTATSGSRGKTRNGCLHLCGRRTQWSSHNRGRSPAIERARGVFGLNPTNGFLRIRGKGFRGRKAPCRPPQVSFLNLKGSTTNNTIVLCNASAHPTPNGGGDRRGLNLSS